MSESRSSHRGTLAIFSNASSLFGTTVVTALLGFAFWWLAARLLPPASVGYGSAAISAMVLLGTIGTLGLETALIGEMAKRSHRCGSLVTASLAVSAAGSAVLGVAFVLVAQVVPHVIPFPAGLEIVALFVLGVALTGSTFVLDAAFVGLLTGGLQLWRNVVFSVAKLVLLYLVAVFAHEWLGVGILAAWIAGIVVSLLWVAVMLRVRGVPLLYLPGWVLVRRLPRAAAAHNWLNVVLDAPHLVIPILATALVSATAGAGFYAAWTILSFAYVVPFHLGTVLYAVGAANLQALQHELRFTLRLSLLGGLIGVPVLVLGAPLVLGVFGPTYAASATLPLQLLALGYFPMVVQAHFVAVCRIRKRIKLAAAVVTVSGLVEIGAAIAGATAGGLVGLSVGVLAAKCLQGAFTARTVVRAAAATTTPFPEASRIQAQAGTTGEEVPQ